MITLKDSAVRRGITTIPQPRPAGALGESKMRRYETRKGGER